MHLAYATIPEPSGRVRYREGLQKIYPQNLKKKETQEKKQRQRDKRSNTHKIYTKEYSVYNLIDFDTLVTQVSVDTQALYTFQDTLSL